MTPAFVLLFSGIAAAQGVAYDRIDTTVGGRAVFSAATGAGDVDVIAAERVRWTLWDGASGSGRLLADLRFTFDPVGSRPLEWTAVRALAVEADVGDVTWTVGRSPVRFGGPRLVDGVQGTVARGEWVLGAWGGLAPDLFTTLPRLRGGGGPILAWQRSYAQASFVGEVTAGAGGLDRVGALVLGRLSTDPLFETTARVDVQVAGDGGAGLADAALTGRLRPSRSVRIDGLYDVYSSLRYQQTEDLDPSIRRFQARLAALGVQRGITQDRRDGTLHHLLGAGVRWRPATSAPAPVVSAVGRWREDPATSDRFARAGVSAGVEGLMGDRLDVVADGTVLSTMGTVREELGATVTVEPVDGLALDGSVRLLLDPDHYSGKPGLYADLFVQGVLDPVVLVGGVYVLREPYGAFVDEGIGGWAQATWRIRRSRPVGVPDGSGS